MPLGYLDETEERLGTVEVVGPHTLDGGLSIDPGDGVDARAAVGVSATDSVPDVMLLAVYRRDSGPDRSKLSTPSGHRHENGPRAVVLTRRIEGAFELSMSARILVGEADTPRPTAHPQASSYPRQRWTLALDAVSQADTICIVQQRTSISYRRARSWAFFAANSSSVRIPSWCNSPSF
jgi:hypothetical protein